MSYLHGLCNHMNLIYCTHYIAIYHDEFSSFCMIYVGKRYDFVWGKGSREYSEMVIRSYVCKHADDVMKPGNLHLFSLAAIHKSGSNTKDETAKKFRMNVIMANITSKCEVRDHFATICLTQCYSYVVILNDYIYETFKNTVSLRLICSNFTEYSFQHFSKSLPIILPLLLYHYL